MLELLKYILPALVVLVATWLVMAKQMQNEDNRRNFELRKNTLGTVTPIRLRGYERLTLLLERITPERLVIDLDLQHMTALQLQSHLLRTIRLEFDHNLSQQVYVSSDVWDAIVLAKEEMTRFVNLCAQRLPEGATALEYAQQLITTYSNNGETPTQVAMRKLKEEAAKLM